MRTSYPADTGSRAPDARNRWLIAIATDAIDAVERRWLRAAVAAAERPTQARDDTPKDCLRRWLREGRA